MSTAGAYLQDQVSVLFTGVGAGGSVSILKALREISGIYLVGVDADWLSAGRYLVDTFYTVPPAAHGEYIPELLRLCRRERINVVVVSVDEEISALAKQQTKFAAAGTKLTISDAEYTLLCMDKLRFYHHMKDNFNLPPLVGKHITKPRFGRGSAGISIDIDAPGCLTQQFIEGDEYTVDVLRAADGVFLATVPRLRIETESGLSVKGRTVQHEELISITQEVITFLGLWGAANVQWIVDADGIPWLIEVNPRLAGGVALTVAAGANIPAGLVRLFNGEQVAPMDFKEMTMLRYWSAVYV